MVAEISGRGRLTSGTLRYRLGSTASLGTTSTDLQREQSIEDQYRVAERLAERHGFVVVAKFCDRAISGGTSARPAYQRMLAAARRREFEAILAEDASRLWRNMAEQAPRLAELADLDIAVVTTDLDTRAESAEILGAVTGAMSAQYRREIGRRTRRGLEGNARAGRSAGGRSFGYIPPRLSATGQLEIDPKAARTVRLIFKMFADGHSPRSIAAALNAKGIPSPGATRARVRRRKGGWVASAISADPKRGSGILNNVLYTGQVIWNRARWVRSAADSSRRRYVLNPRNDWIVRRDERLRIVPEELWQRVKARQAEQSRRIGEAVKRGLTKAAAHSAGAGSKFLLSGLLRCAHCGSSYSIAGLDRYACSGHTSGGDSLCSNSATLRRQLAEAEVTGAIKRELRDPVVIQEICRRVRAQLREGKHAKRLDHSGRIAQLRAEVENLTDAIAGGALRASPAIAARLRAAEQELERLTLAPTPARPTADVTRLLADLTKRAEQAIDRLEETLAKGDIARARQEMKDHVGVVSVEASAREIRLYSEQGVAATLLRVAGGAHTSSVGSGGRI